MSDQPVSFTPREWELLLRQWHSASDTLINRDGTDERFKNGGHRIKQDPLLIRAIEEIRDGYFALFNRKRALLHEQKTDPQNPQITIDIMNADYDLIVWNNQSYGRLKQPNYGLDEETVNAVRHEQNGRDVPDMPGLEQTDAAKITGTIIKRSINAFEITFARDGTKRPYVPHLPVRVERPEAANHTRSEPPSPERFVLKVEPEGKIEPDGKATSADEHARL